MSVISSACQPGLALLLTLAAVTPLPARQAGVPAGDEPGATRLKVMERHARSLKVAEVDSAPIPLMAEPLLRYDDRPRHLHDATLWAWGTTGRPAAVLKVEDYADFPAEIRWIYGLAALATGRIAVEVEGPEGWRWTSSRPGLDLRVVPGAPAPAETEAGRLGQMKPIARRFEAHEDGGPARGRLQLRLLPRPVHRYADPAAGIQDGAIFAFAYGTNPDLLLVIESRRAGAAPPAWHYAPARLGGGATALTLDGAGVYTAPAVAIPTGRETYMNRRQRDLPGP